MTVLKHINISNFKGVRKLEMDVGLLNIITGKNNAGKTSILQAIELAFNPQRITSYEESVSYLINAQSDVATVEIDYHKVTQTSLLEFTESQAESSRGHKRRLQLTEPSRSRSVQVLVDAVLEISKTGPEADLLVDRFSGTKLNLDLDDIDANELVQNSIRNAVANIPEEELGKWAEGSVINIQVDDETFPYVYLGSFYSDLREHVIKAASQEIMNKLGRAEVPLIEEEPNELKDSIDRVLNDLLIPRFGRGRFIDGRPDAVEGIRSAGESIQLSQDDVDMEKENAAVRMSRIGDYLRKHNLIENLDTLSLDQIVFDPPDDEKYQVPYSFQGDGFKALVGVLWLLSDNNGHNEVLLMEEAENHMHPEYTSQLAYHLIDICSSKQIQTFLTTHNIDFIRSFLEGVSKEMEDFLINEFKLLKMDREIPEEFNYARAKKEATQLQLDLRG